LLQRTTYNQGVDVHKYFPDFDKNFAIVKNKVRQAKYIRKQMPVVKGVDLERFFKWMKDVHDTKIKKTKIKAVNLIPIQKQIYLDHPIFDAKKFGIADSIKFVLSSKSHLITSQDNYIMDGNHRWLMVALHNMDAMINCNQVSMNGVELKEAMDDFTDNVTKRKRNESATNV
jgi:hypothetical protein